MTGLEKILEAINDEAQSIADQILEDANNQAREVIEAAKLEAEKKAAQIEEKAELDVRDITNRSESAADLQKRKILLETKQQLINSTIAKARRSLAELSVSEYTDIILSMIKRFAHNQTGKIQFSSVDKNKLPADIDARIKIALSESPMAELSVSEIPANIDGGFLLIYGEIEENCSFDALFAAERDTLQDKVHSLLFEE